MENIYKYKDQIIDTPLAHKLYDMLMKISNDEYYVLCVMAELHTDDEIKKMLSVLDAGVTDKNIIALVPYDIDEGRI